jgi:DNA-directed RNA polymerase alpha subunit
VEQQHSGAAGSDLPKLSKPAHRALASAGIRNLQDLSAFTEDQVSKLHGMGPKSIAELRAALAKEGLSFASGEGP